MSETIIDQLQAEVSRAQSLLEQLPSQSKLAEQSKDLESQTLAPGFWQSANAQSLMQEIARVKNFQDEISKLNTAMSDAQAMLELNTESPETKPPTDWQHDLESTWKTLATVTDQMEIRRFLSGPFDHLGAILSIHAGQGGTEAMDWAEMLSRMYSRYFESKNWQTEIFAISQGEEAGIKSVEYAVKADYAYGYLKKEQGTHRLVRLSPFNADNLRQTSFALVEVTPLIDAHSDDVVINESDLEWKFTRAGGAGGQNVNKVNTAVELTHQPSQTTVKCREERTQAQNRERALQKLKSILAQQQDEEFRATIDKEKGQHTQASWGNQIRNYVLHPYTLVKDTRTQVETNDAKGVLDGNLEEFINAEIRL